MRDADADLGPPAAFLFVNMLQKYVCYGDCYVHIEERNQADCAQTFMRTHHEG